MTSSKIESFEKILLNPLIGLNLSNLGCNGFPVTFHPTWITLISAVTTNPNAKKLDVIEKINAEILEMAAGTGSNRGTGGMITKLHAADYATKRGVEVSVINGSNPENLYEVIDGNKIGTKFLPVK